ncbi:MAG: hypothetical protein KBS89_01075 [Bacteroidales bacterium]|nr:hypothetical protein [Candidatus Egerieousia equi]
MEDNTSAKFEFLASFILPNGILNIYPTTAEGTRYSEEFAAFLKGADGPDASYRPIVRALFHD